MIHTPINKQRSESHQNYNAEGLGSDLDKVSRHSCFIPATHMLIRLCFKITFVTRGSTDIAAGLKYVSSSLVGAIF